MLPLLPKGTQFQSKAMLLWMVAQITPHNPNEVFPTASTKDLYGICPMTYVETSQKTQLCSSM